MRTIEQTRNPVQDLIVSYEARVDAIGAIIDNTYKALDNSKDRKAELSAELKETITNRMIKGIFLNQEEKEKKVRQSLKNFLKKQKIEAYELRDALTKGEIERMRKAQIGIEKGITEIKVLLKDYYGQQKELSEELRKLLAKGKDLKIIDFKDIV